MLTKQSLWSFILVETCCVSNLKELPHGTVIERVDGFNFLGLRISHDLKWKIHIQTMSQKLSNYDHWYFA